MEINIDLFETCVQDTNKYNNCDFNQDDDVPECVIYKLKENRTNLDYQLLFKQKVYRISKTNTDDFLVESAIAKHTFIQELINEIKPIINIIQKFADSHESVKWEELPISDDFRATYNVKTVDRYTDDFQIIKLLSRFNKKKKCFKLFILTSEPKRYNEHIETFQIGELYISKNGKKVKSYCNNCKNCDNCPKFIFED